MSAIIDQGTADWLLERVGYCTASRFADVIAVSKKDGSPLAKRKDYLTELIVETLTGQPISKPDAIAMRWGRDHEDTARQAYADRTGHDVDTVGFLKHAKLKAGCSPDGIIVTASRGLEIKCPFNSAVHLDTLLNGMPDDHMAQVQGAMWITGYDAWDFVSYDPRMPERMQLHVQTIPRSQAFIDNIEAQVRSFLAEADAAIATLRERFAA